jgi:kynureninase
MMVSAVFFESARIVPHLEELAERCADRDVPLLVDAYHALGAMPFSLRERGLGSALVTGGGYKYLQLGEGNCFLRLPPGLDLRPANTGWFAEFATMTAGKSWELVRYGPGAAAFAGATYDPTSHYRAARVFDFFRAQGLTPGLLREVSQHQVRRLADRFDASRIPESVVRRPAVPLASLGAFLALETPHAGELARSLAERGVLSDSRGRWLRLGPAPYLSDEQLDRGVEILGEVAAAFR